MVMNEKKNTHTHTKKEKKNPKQTKQNKTQKGGDALNDRYINRKWV